MERDDNALHPSQAEKERQATEQHRRKGEQEPIFPGKLYPADEPVAMLFEMDGLQAQIMEWAESKGWNQGLSERSFGDWCSLMHTEISEAYEDYRAHRSLGEVYYEFEGTKIDEKHAGDFLSQNPTAILKPCGIPIEMADLVIRVLHIAAFSGYSLSAMIDMKMAYNATRPFRHGDKKV